MSTSTVIDQDRFVPHLVNILLFLGLAAIAYFAPEPLKPIFCGFAFGFVVFGVVSLLMVKPGSRVPRVGLDKILREEKFVAAVVVSVGALLSTYTSLFDSSSTASWVFFVVSVLTVSTSVRYPDNGRFHIQSL